MTIFWSLLSGNLLGKQLDAEVKLINDAYREHPQKGLELSEELLSYGMEQQDDAFIAEGYFHLGWGNFLIGRIRLSNEYFDNALGTQYARNHLSFQGKCWKGKGTNFDFLNEQRESLESYQKALKLFEKAKDSAGIAIIWNNIGMLDMKLMQYSNSEIYLKKALDYFKRHHLQDDLYGTYQNLSLLYARQGKHELALEQMFTILNKYRETNAKVGEIHMLYNIALVYVEQSKEKKAIEYFERALSEAEKINATDMMADIYMHLGSLKNLSSELLLKYLQEAKTLYAENGNLKKLDDVYLLQLNFYAKKGDIGNYETTLNEYRKNQGELAEKGHAEKYEELKAIYEFEKKEDLIEEQQSKIKIKNQLLWSSGALITLLIIALVVFYNMYIRIREYSRSLYKMNIDLQTAGVLQMSFLEDTNDVQNTDDLSEEITNEDAFDNGLTSKLKDLYDEIILIFEKEKLFKQNLLSVSDISKRLNTNDKYVSQAINTYGNGNFSSLVNAYRINEARRLIEEHGKDIAIKELADQAGFNSLNTFYKKFKEATGLTPLMYIEIATEK